MLTASQGKIIVECKDGSKRYMPEETVESIMIFGNIQFSLGAQKKCLENGISVTLLSKSGHYFGRLVSTSFTNAERIKKQVYLSDNECQRVRFVRITLMSKIHNQIVLLRRYSRNATGVSVDSQIQKMLYYEKKIETSDSLNEIMGYEGIAARKYFEGLSMLVTVVLEQPTASLISRNVK